MKYIMLVAILMTLMACGDKHVEQVNLDEQATCEVNGGQWREFIVCDENGEPIEFGGACNCASDIEGMAAVCEKAMEDFFNEDL